MASRSTTARPWRSSSRSGRSSAAPRSRYVYFPNHAEVPEAQAVVVRGRSFVIGALVDLPAARRTGRALRPGLPIRRPQPLREGQPAALREQLRRHVRADGRRRPRTCRPATNLILSASFEKDGEDPPPVATGILSLYHGDKKVGEGRIKTQPGGYMIAGEGLAVGRDVGDPVTHGLPRRTALPLHRRHDQPSRRRRQRRALRRPRARGPGHAHARVAPTGPRG